MENEPQYGWLRTDKEELAKALELVRRRVCAYGGGLNGHGTCDCKYGLDIDKQVSGEVDYTPWSEQTGCPELRSVIHMLLHSEE